MRLLLTLAFILSFQLPASAQESLRFKAYEGFKEQQITKKFSPDALIATIDLNDDFIDEYILEKQTNNPKFKRYTVIALENRKPIKIGEFDAYKLLVDTKKRYGIRNLIIYNNPHNDFHSKTALWDPYTFSYVIQ